MLYGTVVIRPEVIEDGIVLKPPISYSGSFEVVYPANKKGEIGQCFARIPHTHLTTKDYPTRDALQHALSNGECPAK